MKKDGKKEFVAGLLFLALFIIWTILIRTVDVQTIGPRESAVGMAALNRWFHGLTGCNMVLYEMTDWMGLVPLSICFVFAGVGAVQLLKRKSLLRVDPDIIILGVYYVIVIACYFVFEMVPINYRPVLIDGYLEASYPSSTTLLVMTVMAALFEQAERRVKHTGIRRCILLLIILFSVFMVIGRLISGVHWLTDIVGSVFLSTGLFLLYRSSVLWVLHKWNARGKSWNLARNCKNSESERG